MEPVAVDVTLGLTDCERVKDWLAVSDDVPNCEGDIVIDAVCVWDEVATCVRLDDCVDERLWVWVRVCVRLGVRVWLEVCV